MEHTLTPPAIPEARLVEGSDGMLLEIDGRVVPNYDATIVPFEEGDVVTGKVVRIDKDEVLIDVGYKSEGVIPNHELSIRKTVDPNEEVELGEEVDALVLTKEDPDGRLILSKKRARFERAWRRLEAAADQGEPVDGVVIEAVKGGLIVDLGIRAFMPASLVDVRRVANLDEYLGQTIQAKVVELNRARNNVVLSRRAILDEERRGQREEILERLQPGLVIAGQVSNIVDFGAFVDLDGIDGLVHISELSWSHVNHPSEVLAIGQRVEVKVVDIDRDRQRVSLSLKETQEDPWRRVLSAYHVGDELEGAVTKVLAFGAFVEILEGVEGLVHISELAQEHVENPREIVQPGDEVRVKILEIDAERRRLSLSTKRVEGQVLPLRGAVAADAIVVDEAFVLGDRSIPLVAADDPPEAEPRMDAAAFSRNVFDATWLARFEASQGVVATRLTQEARQWRQLGQAVGYFPGEPSETEWDEVGFQDALVEAQADLTDERVRFLLLLFDASEATWAGAVTAIEQLIAHARDGELTPADFRPADWCLYGMDTTITTAGTPADWRGEQLQAPRLPAARALHTELVAALQGALIVT